MVAATVEIFVFFYSAASREKKRVRKRERRESFETCSRIPILLVGINVTTQAPSCNNTSPFQQQQHQHPPTATTPAVATLAVATLAVATITQELTCKRNMPLST
jgi:hypothetical protein